MNERLNELQEHPAPQNAFKSSDQNTQSKKFPQQKISDLLQDKKDMSTLNPIYDIEDSKTQKPAPMQPIDEMDLLNTPFNWKAEFLPILIKMIGESILGAMVFLLMMGSLIIVTIFAGQLEDPSLYVTACGISISYVAIFASILYGLDTGFNVVISRCKAVENYSLIRKYFIRQHCIVNAYLVIFIGVFGILYWLIEFQYSDKPELLYYIRQFFISVIPTIVFLFNIDILRQLNLGMSNYLTSFICEVLNTISSILMPYILTFWFDFGFYGIIFGTALGQLGGYLAQVISILLVPHMKDFRAALFNSSKGQKKLLTTAEKITVIDEDSESISIFDDTCFYLKFSLAFSLNFFLENCWLRYDTVVASLFLNVKDVASLVAFYNVANMFDCFSYGFGFATSSKLSKHFMDGQIHKAKCVSCIALITSILLGLLFGAPFTLFSRKIASCFISSGESIDILEVLLEKYILILP